MPFWSKSLAQEIRRLAALDQRSGMTFHEVKDEARHVAAQLLELDDEAYARTLRDLLNRPGGLFRAYHLPAAVYGSPRARATLRTADDVRLVAGILLQAYGRSSSPLQAAPFPFLMGPLESILGGAVEAVDVKDPGLERAMPVLTDLLALEHPALAGVTGRCARRLPELSRAAFDSLLRRWSESGGRLGRQIAVIRTAAESNHDLFEALVLLLLDAPQPEPTQEWQRRWSALRLMAAGMPLRQLVIAIIEVELSPSGALVGEPESMTRGAIWALASWDDADARDLLESIVLAAVPSDVLANAAIWSLAHPNDEQSLVRLQRVGDRVRHRGLKTRALEALRRAAAARDTTPESLADQLVADQGLDEHGERYWELGAYRVRIRLGTDGGVERTITGPDGESRPALPKSIQDAFRDAWREIATTTVQLKSTLTTQKHRLDEAMSDGRRWSSGAWQASIAAHPVMARLAARLVWRAAFDGREEFVMPTSSGEWETHDRRRLTIPASANLSIPHVLEIPTADQEGWQRRIVSDGIVQPFRQLFREVYAVTPVERQAGDHSSRFAGHSVPLAQVYALTKTRGWKGKLGLAGFYGAGEGWKEFPTRHLRVGLRHGGGRPAAGPRGG